MPLCLGHQIHYHTIGENTGYNYILWEETDSEGHITSQFVDKEVVGWFWRSMTPCAIVLCVGHHVNVFIHDSFGSTSAKTSGTGAGLQLASRQAI